MISEKLKVENRKSPRPLDFAEPKLPVDVLVRGGLGRGAKAFTLAEVLITLGVIGAVSAITMPTLIQNYQKHVTITKLKHFSSVLRQASAMRNKDIIEGNFVAPDDTFEPYNGADAEKIFNLYLNPYIKIINTKVMNKGIFAFFSDGSVMYYQKTRNCGGPTACSYVTYCTEYKYCKDIDEKEIYEKALDTKHNFLFWIEGKTPAGYSSREFMLSACNGTNNSRHDACSALIERDGWRFEKDYPW